MKIELVVDKNCLSIKTYIDIKNRLAKEFRNNEIIMTIYNNNEDKLRKLVVNILPAWIIDGEIVRINPTNYHELRKKIIQKSDHLKTKFKK